jgi:hypothetical protein
MREEHPSAPAPDTTATIYLVTYHHSTQRWGAQINTHTTNGEGATVQTSGLRRDFGPFDDSTSVAQWLCREVHAHTKQQPAKVDPPGQDPPQGRQHPGA